MLSEVTYFSLVWQYLFATAGQIHKTVCLPPTKLEVTVRLYCLNNKILFKKKKNTEEKFYHASLCKGNYNKYKMIWKMKTVFHRAVKCQWQE